jgi:hypothetical protein
MVALQLPVVVVQGRRHCSLNHTFQSDNSAPLLEGIKAPLLPHEKRCSKILIKSSL